VRFGIAVLIALLGAGCARVRPTADVPIAEATYQQAARHCHAKQVIRIRRGIRNVFGVSGLEDPRTGKPSGETEVEQIECVRQYLGIPRADVLIVYN
jgi:hypothetical protein